MARPPPPSDADVLCNLCGYILTGLPEAGPCPECGTPIRLSTTDDGRELSVFETRPTLRSFVGQTWRIVVRPTDFFRALRTRHVPTSSRFARLHECITCVALVATLLFHLLTSGVRIGGGVFGWVATLAVMLMLFWIALIVVYALVERLTSLEARFWGIRLPLGVVERVLTFHRANLVPAWFTGLLIAGAAWIGFRTGMIGPGWIVTYLYVLSVASILCVLYLFRAYWLAMRAVMYANR